MNTEVSVIIPVHNAVQYLQSCLDSIYAQTFTGYEIIAINDGSTDDSLNLLKKNHQAHQIEIINQTNHGQGYARNQGLKRARGKYVLFVDADDRIDPELLAVAVSTGEKDTSDVINFHWRLLQGSSESASNSEQFDGQKLLAGKECEQFLKKRNYFAWDSLYRRQFLLQNNIRFGEGYIYEDNEFIVQVASFADKISLVQAPFYVVRHDNVSSSRGDLDSPRHYHDFLRAMQASFAKLTPRTPYSAFYLAAYFLEKFLIYYQERIPRKYLKAYLREFVDVMHGQQLVSPSGHDYRFLRSCLKKEVFARKRYGLFRMGVVYKTKVLPARDRLQGIGHE